MISSKFNNNSWLYLGTLFVILIGFHLSYDLRIVLPENINWLMSAYHDWGVHYLGWAYLREEPWTFPLGAINDYNYPGGTNIGYTDSIPLLGVFFKIFSPLLPEPFQYFGLYILISHLLAGVYTIKILRLFRVDTVLIFLAAVLVSLNPLLFYRVMHPGTTAHWMIFASLYYYLLPVDSQNVLRLNIKQVILLVLAALINPYLFLFLAGFNFILPFRHYFYDKLLSLKQAALFFFTSILLVLLSWYVLGMISFNNEVSMEVSNSYGLYGANLNTFFNSGGFSSIFPSRKSYVDFQYEGYAYLGLGMMIFLLLSFGFMLFFHFTGKKKIRFDKTLLPLLILTIGLTLFAITHVITFADKLLIELPIPDLLNKLGSVFRASGRFIWLLYYLLIFTAVVFYQRVPISNKFKVPVLTLMLFIQLYDIQPYFQRWNFRHGDYSPEKLQDEQWLSLMSSFDRIITYPPFENSLLYPSDYQDLCFFALRSDKPISMGYVARSTNEINQKFLAELHNGLLNEKIDKGDLYITTAANVQTFFPLLYNHQLNIGYLDGYYYLYANDERADMPLTPSKESQAKTDSILNRLTMLVSLRSWEIPEVQAREMNLNIELFSFVNNVLKVNGWAFEKGVLDSQQDSLFIGLYNGDVYYVKAPKVIPRQDVTSYFNATNLDNSGFDVTMYTHDLPGGDYNVVLLIKKTDGSMISQVLSSNSPINIVPETRVEPLNNLSDLSKRIAGNIETVEISESDIYISGWAFVKGQAAAGSQIRLLLIGEQENYTSATLSVKRGDVTAYFGRENNYDDSGFMINMKKKSLKRGTYTLGLIITGNGGESFLYLSDRKIEI